MRARVGNVNSMILPKRLNSVQTLQKLKIMKGLILAQNERWRRGLGMQVERESSLRGASKVAKG